MADRFDIQAGSPRCLKKFDGEDRSLSDALQTVFVTNTEDLLLCWNAVYVPLSYRYDFSFLIEDVVDLCTAIRASASGSRQIAWPTNTFRVDWTLRWAGESLSIDSSWETVLGGTEALLNSRSSVSLATSAFLAEWKRPLQISHEALLSAGYRAGKLRTLDRLGDLVTSLPRFGVRYEELNS